MSNGPGKFTMEFDRADGPMLVHALQIAACTALMCGHSQAQARLQTYRDAFKAFAPPEAKFFDEEAWAEIGMALVTAKSFKVMLVARSWQRDYRWWDEGVMRVEIGDKAFEGRNEYVKRKDLETPKAVLAALQELAPMACVGELVPVEEPAW